MSNPEVQFEASPTWEERHGAAALRKAMADKALLEKQVNHAAETGKEPFDTEKVVRLYYPNDWTNDEEGIRQRAETFKADYYDSPAMTIEEWARAKEAIEAQGDS